MVRQSRLIRALAGILPDLETEIVKRSDRVKGFVVQPRRWVVERTIAWLNRCRRLAKDWENLNRNAPYCTRSTWIAPTIPELHGRTFKQRNFRHRITIMIKRCDWWIGASPSPTNQRINLV